MTIEEAREEVKKLQQKKWNTPGEYKKAVFNVIDCFVKSNSEFVARKCAEKLTENLIDIKDVQFGDTKVFPPLENG